MTDIERRVGFRRQQAWAVMTSLIIPPVLYAFIAELGQTVRVNNQIVAMSLFLLPAVLGFAFLARGFSIAAESSLVLLVP
jgi:hypothetical protein